MTAPERFRYAAFISYSHKDHAAAVALHKSLEAYRTPRDLIGAAGGEGPVPRRVGKVFRDEEELGAVPHLGSRIESALESSAALIVVCSPNAAASPWVAREIDFYRALGREDRIFAYIVDGEPFAANPEEECFPETLKQRVKEDGSQESADFLGVDLRKFGAEDSALKIISGLFGVDYDDLKRRDLIRQRSERRRTRAFFAGGLVLFAGAAAGVALSIAQTWSVNTQRSMLFAEKAKAFNDEGDHLRGLLWALGGLPHDSELIKGDHAQARAQAVRAYRKNIALIGHKGAVNFASYSPDGTRVVTASDDGTAKIWDTSTGKETLTLTGHAGALKTATFSSDGAYILTASDDATVKIWDANAGKEVKSLMTDGGSPFTSAFFSPDGTMIVTTAWDRMARIWSVAEGSHVKISDRASHNINSAIFSPDGRNILISASDGAILVWNIATQMMQARALIEPKTNLFLIGPFYSARFSPDGRKIVVTSSIEGTAIILDADTGSKIQILSGQESFLDSVTSSSFSPDSKLVVTSSGDGTSKLWDADSGLELLTLRGQNGSIRSAEFSPDGRKLVTPSNNGSAIIWDISLNVKLQDISLNGNSAAFTYAEFSPRGNQLITSSSDDIARLWNLDSRSVVRSFPGHTNSVTSVHFSPTNAEFATTSVDGTVNIWALESDRPRASIFVHEGGVHDSAFSPDGRRIATASSDGAVIIWDATTGEKIKVISGHKEGLFSVRFSPNGQQLLTASVDNTARIWDAESGRELQLFAGHKPGHFNVSAVTSAVFADRGELVVTAGFDNSIRIWDRYSGNELRSVIRPQNALRPTNFVYGLDTASRSNIVAGAENDGSVTFWDILTGVEILHIFVSAQAVRSVDFAPDESRLVTASADGTVKFWDAMKEQASWSRREMLRHGCERIVLQGLSEFEETSPILSGAAPDGSALKNPCDRRGLLSLDWWSAAANRLYRDGAALIARIAQRSDFSPPEMAPAAASADEGRP